MTREPGAATPENAELSVAVVLRHLGRGDAFAAFGRRARGAARRADLTAAARDYPAGIEVLDQLVQQTSFEGTDVKTLDAAREEIARIRADLAAVRWPALQSQQRIDRIRLTRVRSARLEWSIRGRWVPR